MLWSDSQANYVLSPVVFSFYPKVYLYVFELCHALTANM